MTKQDDAHWTPRQDDHLVEPFFGGLDHGAVTPPEYKRELDPFGEETGSPNPLQRGAIPLWWIWISLAAGAGALWVLW